MGAGTACRPTRSGSSERAVTDRADGREPLLFCGLRREPDASRLKWERLPSLFCERLGVVRVRKA